MMEFFKLMDCETKDDFAATMADEVTAFELPSEVQDKIANADFDELTRLHTNTAMSLRENRIAFLKAKEAYNELPVVEEGADEKAAAEVNAQKAKLEAKLQKYTDKLVRYTSISRAYKDRLAELKAAQKAEAAAMVQEAEAAETAAIEE